MHQNTHTHTEKGYRNSPCNVQIQDLVFVLGDLNSNMTVSTIPAGQ